MSTQKRRGQKSHTYMVHFDGGTETGGAVVRRTHAGHTDIRRAPDGRFAVIVFLPPSATGPGFAVRYEDATRGVVPHATTLGRLADQAIADADLAPFAYWLQHVGGGTVADPGALFEPPVHYHGEPVRPCALRVVPVYPQAVLDNGLYT